VRISNLEHLVLPSSDLHFTYSSASFGVVGIIINCVEKLLKTENFATDGERTRSICLSLLGWSVPIMTELL